MAPCMPTNLHHLECCAYIIPGFMLLDQPVVDESPLLDSDRRRSEPMLARNRWLHVDESPVTLNAGYVDHLTDGCSLPG